MECKLDLKVNNLLGGSLMIPHPRVSKMTSTKSLRKKFGAEKINDDYFV